MVYGQVFLIAVLHRPSFDLNEEKLVRSFPKDRSANFHKSVKNLEAIRDRLIADLLHALAMCKLRKIEDKLFVCGN